MGLFDFLKPAQKTYNTKIVSEIILADGIGGSFAKNDFVETWNKLNEVFPIDKSNDRLEGLLYTELIAARLMMSFLACRELRYISMNKSSAMLEQAFVKIAEKFFSEVEFEYSESLVELFQYRRTSYTKAYEKSDSENKNMAMAMVFIEYLSNSYKNRPLLYEVPNSQKPWLNGVVSMNAIHNPTQEQIKFSLILATSMIYRANDLFSTNKCIIVD